MYPIWATTPELLETPSDESKIEAAKVIAADLIRYAEGPLEEPSTWRAYAAARCRVRLETFHNPAAKRGEYMTECEGDPSGTGNPCGVIVINTAYTPREQAETYIHELAHYLLHVWIPPRLADAADVYRYSDDPFNVRHQIARLVEALVLGEA